MISGSRLHAEVERIAALGYRRCGSAAEHRAMEYIRDRFQEIGLQEIAIEWFDMHRWEPTRVGMRLVPEDVSVRCKPIWYAGCTAAEGLQEECVYCGYGMPQQFGSARDKIAVIDSRILLHFWPTYWFFESYRWAVEAGAKALVVIIDAPGDLIPIFTAEEEKHDNPIPAVLIGRSDGAQLRSRMKQGKAVVSLILEAEAGVSQTGDVVGLLPRKSDEYIIIGAHHDSIYEGAVDNAGGIAALLALAEEFTDCPDKLQKNVIFATHPGHELLIGAREFIGERSDMLEKTVAYITLDGIGCDNYKEIEGAIRKIDRDEVRGAFISPNPILAEIALPVIRKYRLQPAALLPADIMCPNEDLEGRFLNAGVPIVDIIGKPIWYHTEEDTPDKCTPEQLERGARAQMEIIERIGEYSADEMRASEGQLQDTGSLAVETRFEREPTIEFAYLPDFPKAGEPALIYVEDFDDREGILVDMKWDIAGETGSKGPALLHVFDSSGEYELKLAVTNNLGAQGICRKIVTVI